MSVPAYKPWTAARVRALRNWRLAGKPLPDAFGAEYDLMAWMALGRTDAQAADAFNAAFCAPSAPTNTRCAPVEAKRASPVSCPAPAPQKRDPNPDELNRLRVLTAKNVAEREALLAPRRWSPK